MLLSHESPRHNLRLLWWLRNIAIIGQGAAIGVAVLRLGFALPVTRLCCILAVLAGINALTWARLHHASPVREYEFLLQILTDMLGLAGLLALTGGAGNPFASLFILQVVIAVIVLPGRYGWMTALVAIALYSALLLGATDPMSMHDHAGGFRLHVEGMWVSFMLLSVLVAWFVSRLSATLRRQDRLLADAEQLATLGLFATQAAHDLGTPLGSLMLLAEAAYETAGDEGERIRAQRMLEQVDRCKQTILRITASAGTARAQAGIPMALDDYIRGLAARFREARPDAGFTVSFETSPPVPVILAGTGLEQAVRNLLENAADASPGAVDMQACWTHDILSFTVRDRGPGIPLPVLRGLGAPAATTKPQGLGMGLYLARAAVLRLGGTLKAHPRDGGGTCVTLRVPLSRISA